MRQLFKTLISLLILGGIVFVLRDTIREQAQPAYDNFVARVFPTAACEKPIPYNIGDFDAKFGITEKYFLEALGEAEAIWEVPYGKNLFEHKPADTSKGVVKVNLIYDYRQETTSTLKVVGGSLKDTKASYDELRTNFTKLKTQYNSEMKALSTAVISFQKRNTNYKTQVQYWNSQGGAPKNQYDALGLEKLALEADARKIQTLQDHVNSLVMEINMMVVNLNRIATELNLTVEQYNTIGASRGESFEEGIYKSDGVNREIDIYEFSNKTKLVRVLAHELGHAIGIDHVEDKNAIMYALNEGKTLTATPVDLSALRAICEALKIKE